LLQGSEGLITFGYAGLKCEVGLAELSRRGKRNRLRQEVPTEQLR
jgi:hypothetical protein